MRPFTARHLALAALVPALFVLSVIPGCSNESEGERCGDTTGVSNNDDCASGLVCTPYALLVNGTGDQANRCCYTDHVSDSRCLHNTGVNAVAPVGGGSSTDADASAPDAGTSMAEAGTGSVAAGGAGGS